MSEWKINKYGEGWDAETVAKFRDVWKRWHLNYMRTGTPKQEQCLRDNHKFEFAERCEALKDAGLLVDRGYKYGTAWLSEPVPEDVLLWLANLPSSKLEPAWV